MEKEFVTYEQALALKELGFDEPCLGERTSKLKNLHVYVDADEMYTNSRFLEIEKERYEDDDEDDYEEFETSVTAPLYQQAFRWLYQKLGIEKGVMPLDIDSQQLLLKELIDKVSSKHLLV